MTDNDLLPLALSLSKGGMSSLKSPFMPFGRLRTGFDKLTTNGK